MKDILNDMIQHTSALGFIELIKVTGTDKETVINAVAEDRSVIMSCTLKNPCADFIGTFGMPNLGKLRTILGFDDYDDNAKIHVNRVNRDGEEIPTTIHFETKNGDFVNDYRLMSKVIIEEKVPPVKFKGATWNIEFEPSVANIVRLKKQSQANSEESTFTIKTDNGDLKVYFGDPSTHSGNFVFESGVSGALTKAWSWPVQQVLSILSLPGDKKFNISDQGVAEITVDSGLANYSYLLPAQTK